MQNHEFGSFSVVHDLNVWQVRAAQGLEYATREEQVTVTRPASHGFCHG